MDFDQTYWVPVRRRQPLSTFYYHEHFIELLDFVEQYYSHALLDVHIDALREFRRLPRNAQCLYVRLVNRKGRVFSRSRLRYPELGNVDVPLADLARENWVGPPQNAHFDSVLAHLTRPQLYRILAAQIAGLSKQLRKAELQQVAREHVAPADFMVQLEPGTLFVQRRVDAIRYLAFLYFGRVQDGLQQFTMRDLGLVNTQSASDGYEPRFADRDEALEHYFFASRLHGLRSGGEPVVRKLAGEIGEWPEPNYAGSAALRDKLSMRLGKAVLVLDEADMALAVYRLGESPGCRERVIRLLLAEGRRDECETFLERCLDNPASDEEWLIARDIYERKFGRKRTTAATDLLRSADTIDIDESGSGAPERAAIAHYESLGQSGWRTENLLWRTLFGLLFWDELFGDATGSSHSPFDVMPPSLADGSFHERFGPAIETKLNRLKDGNGTRRELLKASTRHYGQPNGVFRWRRTMLDAVFALLEHAPAASVRHVLDGMARQYTDRRHGYPDLLLVDGVGIRFVEIKAEGDQVRRNQLLRIRELRQAGFRADVVRVRWTLDPEQTYVVVDVETTGGRGERHRVTEIGAVKVRDGEIVDRFQTLLNPQRTIPPGITRLTGISEAMVADAPYFADVADAFEAFMEGAIFVAHNVEFDYGFISGEFRRIGRTFRYPKLCTCASMRRLYPGHRSYSLAALARAYDIPLHSHHRAMCDAEAAAQLLLIVNEKRQQLLRQE